MELMFATYLVTNCKDLFKAASDFAMSNRKKIVKTRKWEEISKNHPQDALKMFEEMTFKP